MMNRLVAIACLCLLAGASTSAADDAPPNILYIMADDHAAHAISAYGSKINQTPNIDRIAKEGMRFTNCFVTNSICTPSRAAILTGKYSHINGVDPSSTRFDGSAADARQVSAEGRLPHRHDRQMASRQRSDRLRLLEHPPGPGRLSRSRLHRHGGTQESQRLRAPTSSPTSRSTSSRSAPKDKPFFLMCHHKAPHRPWEPDEKHAKMWENVADPGAGDVQRRLRHARRRRAAEATMRIDRDLTANRPEGAAARRADRRRAQEVEVSAVHAATTSPASPRSTTTSAGCSTISTRAAWPRTPS